MANGFNGGFCKIYKGTFATKTEIVGQGDASLSHAGAPIEINNKSTGGFREDLDGSISTRALDIDIEYSTSDDASFETLVSEAFSATTGEYVFVFTNDDASTVGYYYEGNFTPVITAESAAKDSAATSTVQFRSSGAYTRTAITP